MQVFKCFIINHLNFIIFVTSSNYQSSIIVIFRVILIFKRDDEWVFKFVVFFKVLKMIHLI